MKLSKIAVAVALMTTAGGAMAHGYISEPGERAAMCQKADAGIGHNQNCGNEQYEPQTTGEGPDGFPLAGPADGTIASGDNTTLAGTMDQQTSGRWVKHPVTAGPKEFTWTYTAPHRTADTKYYMTKQNWDENTPLTRESFDLTPFCVIDGNNQIPAATATHTCELPSRSGYQVILANWDVADTAATFHKVIDVVYEDGATVSEWGKSVGQIAAKSDLYAGSTVETRVFDKNGERADLKTVLSIESDEMGVKELWSKALAEKINAEQKNIRAGIKNGKGQVNVSSGNNMVYNRVGGEVVSTEIQVNAVAPVTILKVSDVKASYGVLNGLAEISYHMIAEKGTDVEESIIDKDGNEVGHNVRRFSEDTDSTVVMPATLAVGDYKLVIIAKKGEQSKQFSYSFSAVDGTQPTYHFAYPEGRGQYQAGTLVKGTDGSVYECQVAGWCNSDSDTYYAPGTGLAWDSAWAAK